MSSLTKITIGIQARSGSTRYPGKIDRPLGGSTILGHVLSSCFSSSVYMNRWADTKRLLVNVALCVPAGDPIKEKYGNDVDVVEGPEGDVLTRYIILAEKYKSDFVVRITSDCPLIIPAVISKHITVAFMNSYDYTSNVDEECRTAPDGYDCEVISRKLLIHAHQNAQDQKDREHVTTWIRKNPPEWAKMGIILNPLDRSDFKISIDTPEDEKRIQDEFERAQNKNRTAVRKYGKKNVHSFS